MRVMERRDLMEAVMTKIWLRPLKGTFYRRILMFTGMEIILIFSVQTHSILTVATINMDLVSSELPRIARLATDYINFMLTTFVQPSIPS